MRDEQPQQHEHSPEQRKRIRRIVIAHLLIVVMFFAASFLWGNFE